MRALFWGQVLISLLVGCGGEVSSGGDAGAPAAEASLPDGCACTPGTVWLEEPCGPPHSACAGVQKKWCGADCQPEPWSTLCEGAQPAGPAEICGNGLDDDCNGQVDEGC